MDDKLENVEKILKKVLSFDDNLLNRVRFSQNLVELLNEYNLPSTLKEDIESFDGLSPAKKRAFAKYLLSVLKTLKRKEKKQETLTEKLSLVELEDVKLKDSKLFKPIEKRALKKVGLESVKDALYYFPNKYEDKRIKKIKDVVDGESGVFKVEVVEAKKVKIGKIKFQAVVKDDTDFMTVNFVYDKDFLFGIFRKGKKLLIGGKVKVFRGEKSIFQPEIYREEDPIIIDRILPVYSLRGDSSIKTTSQTINHLRRAIFKIVNKYSKYVAEHIPEHILEKYKLPKIDTALANIHFPQKDENIDVLNDFESRYQKRFIFEELFILQLAQEYKKAVLRKEKACQICVSENFLEDFEEALPFELTGAQKRAISEILQDINKTYPMNRLVQGDVGSGKTVVAAAAALAAALNKKQVAVMAPTEILAKQHYENFKKFLEPFGVKVGLLTGSLPEKEKRSIRKQIEKGEAQVIVGTHALIQEKLKFKDLALAIVDEQHRFGVEQRKRLAEKAKASPHILVMTATPIPRTLTMAVYGDLEVSILNQLPKGRKKVSTTLLFDDEREGLYKSVRRELEKGRQAFVVYPLIEESEKLDLKSAEEGFKHWQEAFPDKKVVMLHGKMSQEEKDRIMEDFKNKKADILVSTTVIEVGVDVPNASVMVIEDAHRFGLSQIHQLRGRVGRGSFEGYCYLVVPSEIRKPSDDTSKDTRKAQTLERLKVLVKTSDGFKIAEEDLNIRGSGDLVGTAQSGKFAFNIANLDRPLDRIILKYAKKEAQELIEEDPTLEKYPNLKKILFSKYADKLDLATIA